MHALIAHPGRGLKEPQEFTYYTPELLNQVRSDIANPERFRLECLNKRTLAAIQLNDLEEALACFEAGRQGARNLESKQRMAETSYAYQLMLKQWPTEKRVKQLKVSKLRNRSLF